MRAFVSIPVPVEALDRPPATLEQHLTVRFLGEIRPSSVPEFQEAIARAAAQSAPFRLELRGVGVFPDWRRPRVLWIGVGEGRAQIEALAMAIHEELARLGRPGEQRPFVPHVTVRRLRSAPEVAAARSDLASGADRPYGSILVERVDLQESTLLPAGAVHRVLASAPLLAPKPSFS